MHEGAREPAATTCHPLFSKSSVHASPGHQEAVGLHAQRGEKEGRCGSSHRRHRAQQGARPAALMQTPLDERLLALRFTSGYLHSCVRSCFQSADSCSNTINDDVICIMTSVSARKYRSRADDNSNSNTPWSRTLLQLPHRYGSVCERQRNVLQVFNMFKTEPLFFCFLSVNPEACSLFLEQAMHFYTGSSCLVCLRPCLSWAGRWCCSTMVMSVGANPTTTAAAWQNLQRAKV